MFVARPHLLIVPLMAIIFSGCVKRNFTQPENLTPSSSANDQHIPNSRININTASAAELEKLPGIGTVLAARIVEHREKYGPFRKPEHLIVVRGFSDRRFRVLRELITVE